MRKSHVGICFSVGNRNDSPPSDLPLKINALPKKIKTKTLLKKRRVFFRSDRLLRSKQKPSSPSSSSPLRSSSSPPTLFFLPSAILSASSPPLHRQIHPHPLCVLAPVGDQTELLLAGHHSLEFGYRGLRIRRHA